MRYLSLFSGIEAASVAWESLGWQPVAFSEIDPFCCEVLKYRFPDVPNLGDITQIDWREFKKKYGTIDLIVGGSPCQSFSIAAGANRTSLDGKSNLMLEYLRAVECLTPKWIIWENVPGVLNTKDNAFGQLLGTLQEIGYRDIAYRVLDSQFYGVAQRRRRVYVIGRFGEGFNSAAVLFDSESLRGASTSSKEKRAQIAARIGANTDRTITTIANDGNSPAIDTDICGALIGGGFSANDYIGALQARYCKGLCADDLSNGLYAMTYPCE